MALSSSTVHSFLRDTAQKVRYSRSGRWLLVGIASSVLLLIIFLLLDAWIHFGAKGRWAGFLFVLGSFLAGLVMSARAWKETPTDEAVARRIEKATEGAGNVLISAVQLEKQLPAGALRTALFDEMRDPFPRVKWDVVFEGRLLKRLGLGLGGVLGILMIWAIAQPGYFSNSAARLFLPAAQIAPLTRTQMTLQPGRNETVPHGYSYEVKAMLGGQVPASVWLWYREAGSTWQKTLMSREAGRPAFHFAWKEVKQPLEYYLEAGDAKSNTFAVSVRPRTVLKTKSATITAPAYTALPKAEVRDFSVLQNIVPGSTVAVAVEFNNPLRELTAKDEKGAEIAVQRAGEAGGTFELKPLANQSVRLSYRDTLEAQESMLLPLAVKADDAPKVTVSAPAEGAQVVAAQGATLAIHFQAEDNFALGRVQLFQSTDEKEDAVLVRDFPEAEGRRNFEATATVTIAPPEGQERVTYRVIARDKNDVTGPGITTSRPIVVTRQSSQQLAQSLDEAATKLTQGLAALIKLQEDNLAGSKAAALKPGSTLAFLVERQVKIGDGARTLIAAAGSISPEVRDTLVALSQQEMKDAVLHLRNADAAKDAARAKFLAAAVVSETVILARLQGAPAEAEADQKQQEIVEIIHGLEDLLKKQRDLLQDTKAGGDLATMAPRQDALADKSQQVKAGIEKDSQNASLGDAAFRERLGKVAAMFGQWKIYEDMLTATEKLEAKQAAPAIELQQRVVVNLAKMVELLNQWQIAEAGERAEDLRKKAAEMQAKLDKLAEIQREILEKTKELARKADFRPEDVATAKEFKEQKDLMKDVLEQMTTDLQAFPETKTGNEMKGEVVSILEDVQQSDKEQVAQGKLKPQEIAVQKEQGILDDIEAAKKIAADMEMWLPSKNETQKWEMENFDKNEMPEIPMLPLADAFEDLVGNLLEAQKDIEEEVQDPASNQAFAMNPANGWEVGDGPMPGFGAQGRSSNQRPNHNEQMGRSSGGREGMSDGEMAAGKAQTLEGDTPTTRRTRDAMQQGQVEDDGGPGKTRATGGGKAGGFSDRQGMEGNAPLRGTQAPVRPADAAAAAQAQLAEKTAKKVAEANLLYIRGGEQLGQVTKLMDENAQAIREGRMKDSADLHQKIIARLQEIKGGVSAGNVVTFASTEGARVQDKQLLGGPEGETPEQYKEQVADYFRSLVEEK